MARTIQEIFDEIEAAKNADANLAQLTSTSNVAIWRLWAYVVATVIHFHEKLWDLFLVEVQAVVDAAAYGTPSWFVAQVYKFQLGDPLTFVGFAPGYVPVNPANQIVNLCAVQVVETVPGQPIVRIKVAKDSGGNLAPLAPAEVVALDGYVDRIKPAGTRTDIISLSPDLLQFNIDIYFNPLYLPATLQPLVETAIGDYLLALPPDGEILETAVVDAIQAVNGVADVDVQSLQANSGAGYSGMGRSYVPVAGYAVIDALFPLSSTLNFIPDNV